MLSQGKLRAEHYSMLGKSSPGFSERSVMYSARKRDNLVANSP